MRSMTASRHKLAVWLGGAENPELSDSSSYDVMIRVIDDLLPPDAADLYPDGMPDDIELDL